MKKHIKNMQQPFNNGMMSYLEKKAAGGTEVAAEAIKKGLPWGKIMAGIGIPVAGIGGYALGGGGGETGEMEKNLENFRSGLKSLRKYQGLQQLYAGGMSQHLAGTPQYQLGLLSQRHRSLRDKLKEQEGGGGMDFQKMLPYLLAIGGSALAAKYLL